MAQRIETFRKTITAEIYVMDCVSCGVVFAISGDYEKRRREDHQGFYCPNGHSQMFGDKTEAEKLREKVKEAERVEAILRDSIAEYRTDLAAEKKQHASTKGKLTKTVNRIHAGVCIHCNRTFVNVQRHMESKHKDEAGA